MRAWIRQLLSTDLAIQAMLGGTQLTAESRIVPRQSQTSSVALPRPFLVVGLGNVTDEDLSEDPEFQMERQFAQIWAHDEGGDYGRIDDLLQLVKVRLRNADNPLLGVNTTRFLELSGEFGNETYDTIFRYSRFQFIRVRRTAA